MSNVTNREIISTLWRGGQFAYLWTDAGKQSKWFNVNEPTVIPATWRNENTYFGIHPCAAIPTTNAGGEATTPERVRSQIKLISAINCVFGEFDAKDEVKVKEYAPFLPDDFDDLSDLAQKTAIKTAKEKAVGNDREKYKARAMERVKRCELAPTLLVDSGGGYHLYWEFAEPVIVNDANRTHVQEVQAAWVDLIGCDPASKDLARVLRVPGTRNVKPAYAPDFPTVTIVEYNPDRLYRFAQIEILTNLDEVSLKGRQAQQAQRQIDKDKPTDSVIAEYNRTHHIVDLLRSQGYTLGWDRPNVARLARPGRDKSQTSVIVFKDGEKEMSYHHSSSDALYDPGHTLDAYDIYVLTEHRGDSKAAYEAAKREQGKWTENKTSKRQAVDPATGEILDLETVQPKAYANGSHANTESEYTKAADASHREDKAQDIETLFLTQSADDEGNAQCVKALHGKNFLYCDAYGWLQHVETHWEYSGLAETNINIAITETLIQRRLAAVKAEKENIIKATKPSATNKENTKRQIKDRLAVDVKNFDEEKYLLNCRSGVIDLRNGQLIAHAPSDRFTYCVNAEYGVQASCDNWLNFISGAVKDYANLSDWLQMACGYSATGYTSEEIMFYLYGPARSGKGTFTNSFLKMLGQPLARGVNFSMFTARREGDSQNFDLAPLKPCRFIAASESGKNQSLNEAVVKQITGNDPISAAFKGKDGFTYFPQFKIWLASNHPVKGDVDDDAFWGRVKVIEFPNSHLGDEDKSLKEQMQSDACRNALLAYTVEGAQMWFNEPHGLVTPDVVKQSTVEQREALDNVQRWLDECVKKIDTISTSNADLRYSYDEWCEHNGEMPKAAVHFGRALKNKGFEPTTLKQAGVLKRGYKGLAIVEPEREPEQ